ncbi:MAG: hypothetical protein K0S63_12 [Gammaproteobacteria bacterium]|nr:hypothetical protein [Gammaproteobacteria bacterium]
MQAYDANINYLASKLAQHIIHFDLTGNQITLSGVLDLLKRTQHYRVRFG